MTRKIGSLIIIGLLMVAFMPSNILAGPADIQKLYEAAKAEGEVIWHVFGPTGPWEPMVKEFEKKYPGIDVKPFGHSVSRMPARLITESQAGKLTLDIPSVNTQAIGPLFERDMLLKEDWAKISPGLEPQKVLMDGYFLNVTDDPLIWAYNTDLVKANEVPKSWDDLLDPKWKGHQISIRAMSGHLIGLYPKWRENPDDVIAFLNKFNKQEVQGAANLGEAFGRVANGECRLGVMRPNSFLNMKADGAPIEICPIGPAVTTPTGNVLLKGIPHPNAARLLLGWIHSAEGAAEGMKANNVGIITGPDSTPVAKLLDKTGIEFKRVAVSAEDCNDYNAFEKAANAPMGWGKK